MVVIFYLVGWLVGCAACWQRNQPAAAEYVLPELFYGIFEEVQKS
jgi:hypothetical protein